MALGATIAKLRQDRGLTQADLAELLYVTRQAVSRWETGETMPGIDMCKLIASTLEVPFSCLLEMPEWPVCQSCGLPMVVICSARIMEKSKDWLTSVIAAGSSSVWHGSPRFFICFVTGRTFNVSE